MLSKGRDKTEFYIKGGVIINFLLEEADQVVGKGRQCAHLHPGCNPVIFCPTRHYTSNTSITTDLLENHVVYLALHCLRKLIGRFFR